MPRTRIPEDRPPAGRRGRLGMIVAGLLVVLVAIVIRYCWDADSASAQSPAAVPSRPAAPRPGTMPAIPAARPPAVQRVPWAARPAIPAVVPTRGVVPTVVPLNGAAASGSTPEVVAVVNGERITRQELAQECLRHYGKEVLESMVNKSLIMAECQRRGIAVTQAEVDQEIRRMAERFSLPVEQWLKMLEQERGIKPVQYANDIIWPTLALRKLAGNRLEVTHQELVEAFENQYGPAVEARMIACSTPEKAEQVRAQAAADPSRFGDLAKEFSEDPSASLKGRIQPIRKHCGHEGIEQAAFTLGDGQVSQVIPAGGQYVILKRERLISPPNAIRFEQVARQLEEVIRERKLRTAAGEIFRALQEKTQVENMLNDPEKSRQMPGVAAVVNGQQISVRSLAEQCIERNGEEVLEGTINRKLLEQACTKRGITVTEEQMQAEIERAAGLMVPPKADGSPDVETWLKTVTESQNVTVDVYRSDAVWPSVALKKLVGDQVQVTDEDLQKGFEANYGPRVRCRAIVMSNFRRAQEVWEMARENPTVERFGDLAAQYSIEPGSQALRGEVPPIRKNGGQPLLEKEAFALKEGELSGIIQVGDKFVILLCEGYTSPKDITFDEVRQLLYDDIYEKKQRLAMADYFDRLQQSAAIDNFLSGKSQSPKPAAGPAAPPELSRGPAMPKGG